MKNTIIIGGGSGIGLKSVELLQNQENLIVLTRSITTELSNSNAKIIRFEAGVDSYENLIDLPNVIDSFIFFPGTINLKPFHRISKDEFLIDFQKNVLDLIQAIQFFLPRIKKSKEASILLFSSVAASIGMPFHTSVAISKGAVESFTKTLAAELAPTIRVNCIAPSLTLTPLAEKLTNSEEKIIHANEKHPLKRIGKPEDIAEMVCFLSSYKASWITGQIFHVDGGISTIK